VHNNSISKLLNLKDIIVKNISHSDSKVLIYIETTKKFSCCPSCSSLTNRVHDYRPQKIKDFPIMYKDTFLILRKRRYACSCGKRFYENYDFLPKFSRMTNRLVSYIIEELRNSVPFTLVAKKSNLSTTTVSRIFDYVNYSKPLKLPEALSIDEFKGNSGGHKYQCILVDPVKRKILDILPTRYQCDLINYFKQYSRQERCKVKFFICDMWRTYAELAKVFFPNAAIIVDKYHFIRQVSWALENVRKNVQKTMPANLRKYYKRSKRLLTKPSYKLNTEEKAEVQLMILYNENLRRAYILKERFYELCHENKYEKQRKAFSRWIEMAENSGIVEFKKCTKTFHNWSKEILNAFKYGYTNGPTEGFNNKIKVIKRVSYGILNFNRLRNKILHQY